jgi:arsenite-transporting ATPase
VGKTTAACAAALCLLDCAHEGEKILLFSTDPAHSLSDSLNFTIGDRLAEIARARGAALLAREMDAATALARFKKKHRGTLGELARRGTFLDESDIKQLLDLSLPGMDEVMALFELSDFEAAGVYARIVVDTAPSGHTSRLLRLPAFFTGWIGALDRLAEKHRYMVRHFGRPGGREDPVELFLHEFTEKVNRVRAMLYDPKLAAFTLVTIPEAMSVEETRRYFKMLSNESVPVTDLIVNRVEQPHGSCIYCRARVSSQKPWLNRISREFHTVRRHTVPLLPQEIRGPAALRRFAAVAWRTSKPAITRSVILPAAQNRSRLSRTTPARTRVTRGASFTAEERHLLIFGGKGGVGKTTAATALALALAEKNKNERVLVVSIDPAHSLSDSFGERVGDFKRAIARRQNLNAMELDPEARFEALKRRYRAWSDKLFKSLTGDSTWEIRFDREATRELLALAPPGIDEITALSAIIDLLAGRDYTSIILDTAPTGHLVRFLELPEIALSWIHAFMKLLLKYKDVVEWAGIAEELVALSREIKAVAALLTDPDRCEFVGVAAAERMSLEETARLSDSLRRLHIPLRRLLINNIVPAGAAAACNFCAERRRSQEKILREFRRRLQQGVTIFVAPQQRQEVRGFARLRKHFSDWEPVA